MRLNYEDEEWKTASICGFDCKFSDIRINKKSIPKGMYFYEIKAVHDESSSRSSTQMILAKNVDTDFYGTIVTNYQLELDKNNQLYLENGDLQIEW